MQDRDYAVIQKVLAGDKRSYAEVVERHKEKAMTLAVRMLKNREDAEEALQDAFVRAFNALPRFEWKSSFSTWFYRIVYNVCASALSKRNEAYHDSIDDDTEQEKLDLVSDEMLPDIEYESNEFQQIVLEELEKLPQVYGSTLTLFFVQEMSYEEIVGVTGLPLGTVKARLFRARSILKDAVVKRLGMNLQPGVLKKESIP